MQFHINNKKDSLNIILFLTLFSIVYFVIYKVESTYPKDNKSRAIKIYKEIEHIVYPNTVINNWSSTRGGTTFIKFTIKGKPNDLEKLSSTLFKKSEDFNFYQGCRDGEQLLFHTETNQTENHLIITWTYPVKSCVEK